MSRIIKKRALLTAAITSLALVAVAIAFYSTTGGGSGSGSTADGYATNLQITGTLDDATLVPGGSAVGITGNVHNPNPGSAHVSTVTGAVTAATGGCDTSYFHIADEEIDDVLTAEDNAAGGTDDKSFTTSITMDDEEAINQDACKDSDLTITWSAVAADE